MAPGLYEWGTGVLFSTDATLSGGPNDIWIFQVAEDLILTNGVSVLLTGGASTKSIVWQCGGTVEVGTTAHCDGVLLSKTAINFGTGASANGSTGPIVRPSGSVVESRLAPATGGRPGR